MKIIVNEARCPQNHICPVIRLCPTQAISQEGYGLPSVNIDDCILCGKCINYCPFGAFQQVEG